MSLLLKHDGRWMLLLSGWWSPTELMKNWSQAMQSDVLDITVFLPLFPCSETNTPSLNFRWIRRKVSLFIWWARSHASRHTCFPLTKNSVSYSPESLICVWSCKNSSTKFLLPVWFLSLNCTSAYCMSSIDNFFIHLSGQQLMLKIHRISSSFLTLMSRKQWTKYPQNSLAKILEQKHHLS